MRLNETYVLRRFFSLEAQSPKPLAHGIRTHPWYLEVAQYPVKDWKQHPGLGISGMFCERGQPERFVAVGNMRFLKRNQMHISRAMRECVDELESMGDTVILCGWGRQAKGVMSFTDTLRTDVKEMLIDLKDMKINPLMITGDQGEAISHLTYAHGLDQVYTRCLPEEKVRKIIKQKKKGQVVGMIANPHDESSPLKAADIGFIIGAGTQEINENAGVSLMGHNFKQLTALLKYSRKIRTLIRTNLSVGLIYNVCGLSLAELGYVNPTSAILAMSATSLLFAILPLSLKMPLLPMPSNGDSEV